MKTAFINEKYTIHDMVMKRPASTFSHRWRDGTPIGNGITGALFYGGISAEHIIISRGDLWYGGVNAPVPDVSHCLTEMRRLQKIGKYSEANSVMYNELQRMNYGNHLADMRNLGCVKMILSCPGTYSRYRRVLHMDTSEAEVSYLIDGIFYKRKYLAARKRDIVAVELTSEQEMCFELDAGFFESFEGGKEYAVRESDAEYAESRIEKDVYIYSSRHEGRYFGIVCRIISAGQVSADNNKLAVKDSKHSLILIKAFSGENDRADAERKAIQELMDCPTDYQSLYEENLPLYKKLYNTADIRLYDGEDFHSNEELLADAKDTSISCELSEKIWRFGRYLFISGTSEEGLPFPLYGLWPAGYERPFTHHVANENVQSIYWHTEVGGLSELVVPLIDYYYEKMEFFRENARKLFGCRGIFVGTYTTPKNATVSWEVPVILHFNGVAGWLAQHFYKYYLYSGDSKIFEEKILPFMIEAAEFYEDFYCTDENGKMMLYPAVSPENTPLEYRDKTKPHAMPVTKNPTIEFAILKELLTHLIQISNTRIELAEKVEIWKYMLSIIPEYSLDENGVVKEWMTPELSDDFEHRHLSHIYPLFPGTELEDGDRDDLIPAFSLAVKSRKNGAFCGWSLGHLSSIYSRLCDSENAYKMLDSLAKVCLLENFFTLGYDYRDMGITGYDCGNEINACVQLDAIMGAVNAIQEMLLFSSEMKMKILPACPKEFNQGKAKLHFQAGVVEFWWNLENKTCHGSIMAHRDTRLKLKLPFEKNIVDITINANEKYVF